MDKNTPQDKNNKKTTDTLERGILDFALIITSWVAVVLFVTKCTRSQTANMNKNQEKNQQYTAPVNSLQKSSVAYFFDKQKIR